MTIETAQEAPDVVIGMFPINSNSATVLFNSSASHSFIAYTFIKKHGIPIYVMKKPMLVNSPGGEMKANWICLAASLIIRGVEFQANLLVIDSSGIDVILGMDWLRSQKAVINCGNSFMNLTTPSGEKVEYVATQSASEICQVNQLKGTIVQDIRIVNEYLDVFPDELLGMPPEQDIEFIIELLPRTAPIAKRPYRMGVNELAKLKKQLRELLDKGYV